jgi:uncharacterized membrane-anchored protein YhcB (DUF1043 family)
MLTFIAGLVVGLVIGFAFCAFTVRKAIAKSTL